MDTEGAEVKPPRVPYTAADYAFLDAIGERRYAKAVALIQAGDVAPDLVLPAHFKKYGKLEKVPAYLPLISVIGDHPAFGTAAGKLNVLHAFAAAGVQLFRHPREMFPAGNSFQLRIGRRYLLAGMIHLACLTMGETDRGVPLALNLGLDGPLLDHLTAKDAWRDLEKAVNGLDDYRRTAASGFIAAHAKQNQRERISRRADTAVKTRKHAPRRAL